MRYLTRGVVVVVIVLIATFAYSRRTCAQSCPSGDVNRDGRVSLTDYEYFRRLFRGDTTPTGTPMGTIPANPKIMPLGDSITMGMHGVGADWNTNKSLRGGYRAKLYELLSANGTTFNFVGGGIVDGRETLPDKDHEGHGGWCITGGGGTCYGDSDSTSGGNGGISHHVAGWLNQYQPDVILLHIGTNDFSGGDQVSDVVSRYGQLIDQIFTARPNVFLFVSSLNIVGRADVNTTFNGQLQQLVQQKAGGGKRAIYVNTYQGMAQPIGSDGDTLHPSLANYEIMGQNWFNAMKPYLGGGTPQPTVPPGGGTNPVGVPGNFTLTFQDEFTTYNAANWTRTYPWDTSGNERRDTDYGTGQIINPANVQVSNGMLKIVYKKIPPETINGITREWESGIIHSRGKKEFGSSPTGTYMEVRAKAVTGGPGQWSFVWLLPNDFATDPTCIVQRYTLKMHETNGKYLQYNNFNVKKRVSCEAIPTNLQDDIKTYQHSESLANGFHTYGMDWYPDRIDFYFDGQKVHSSTQISGIDRPGFLIINGYVITNIGLNDKNFFPFDGVPTSATPSTAEYLVDYVRVWRRT